MSSEISKVVIVGGGSAGWLTAGIIAAKLQGLRNKKVTVSLVESPDIPTIGVGEGTWPSMRTSLKMIGISESEFMSECDASFKQGSRFINWLDEDNHHYYHPFTLPIGYPSVDLASYIASDNRYSECHQSTFEQLVGFQGALCDNSLAPKQISTPSYGFVANYGYHLNAGKFSELLRKKCTEELGVKHILANLTKVKNHQNGDIASIELDNGMDLKGHLFVDCSGSRSLLLGEHYGVPLVELQGTLFNNRAFAAQVPYTSDLAPIASATLSTANSEGWIWDIGLQSRRGVGCVFSSQFDSQEKAEQLLYDYIRQSSSRETASNITLRSLQFEPGYRAEFWRHNCVAVGMSAGFIEPLEASALAMVEQSAHMIAEQFPIDQTQMKVVAKRLNRRVYAQWQQIIDFLKLHYVLSKRSDSPYWSAHRDANTCPQSLKDMLTLWTDRPPGPFDVPYADPLFPYASYQYVLYGMKFSVSPHHQEVGEQEMNNAQNLILENQRKRNQLMGVMPSNRELLSKINQYGMSGD